MTASPPTLLTSWQPCACELSWGSLHYLLGAWRCQVSPSHLLLPCRLIRFEVCVFLSTTLPSPLLFRLPAGVQYSPTPWHQKASITSGVALVLVLNSWHLIDALGCASCFGLSSDCSGSAQPRHLSSRVPLCPHRTGFVFFPVI